MALRLLSPPRMEVARPRAAGFTLMELLVVVGIIGVLAAIAIPAFSGRQGKAYDARLMQDLRNMATAEEAYYVDNGAYLDGDCRTLPGATLSPGVVCTATVSGDTFSLRATHPNATKSCVYSTTTQPNLICS